MDGNNLPKKSMIPDPIMKRISLKILFIYLLIYAVF